MMTTTAASATLGQPQATMTTETGDRQQELSSLAESRTSDHSENATASGSSSRNGSSSSSPSCGNSDNEEEPPEREGEQEEQEEQVVRCSAVHTLERDMPDYDYSGQVAELRAMITAYARDNEGTYSPVDLEKCKHDEWFLSRFLLRQKMNLDDAFDMLKRAMRFNHESLAHHLKPGDFPAEFYQLGGIFPYGQDRKGNRMLYMRVRVHRKTPEIQAILQAFIYYNIKRLDDEAQGKGECAPGVFLLPFFRENFARLLTRTPYI